MTEENNEEYGVGKKEIIFRETVKRHADLKIQLQYDHLKVARFLRECVGFYLNKDPLMMELVDRMKGVITIPKPVSKVEMNIVKKDKKEAKKVETEFALNENEVENIFDTIEENFPDL